MKNYLKQLSLLTGRTAEQRAQHYLQKQGLTPVTSNYRCRQGEIDLIMDDKGTLVFVEVKYRKNAGFGSAMEAVTPAKQRKVRIAAQHYLCKNNLSETVPMRFDVFAICGQQVEWLKSAF